MLWLAIAMTTLFLGCSALGLSSAGMTQQRMARVLGQVDGQVQGEGALIRLTYDGVKIACISDEEHDRMRLVSTIKKTEQLSSQEVAAILQANFHSTLDARYATSEGIVVATFVHPLASLTDEELRSGVRQVTSLVKTFGTTYSSGELMFGGTR